MYLVLLVLFILQKGAFKAFKTKYEKEKNKNLLLKNTLYKMLKY